jgi:hypothetical protein
MLDDAFLARLSEGVTPSTDARERMRSRINRRIEPVGLRTLARETHPSPQFARSLRERVLGAIHLPLASDLRELVHGTSLDPSRGLSLRENILARLSPVVRTSRFQVFLRWTAAFVFLLFLVRMAPLVLLAPKLQAETGAQLVPAGHVEIFTDGLWQVVDSTRVLEAPVIVRTAENAHATIILGDDGVVRLGANTTLRIHSLEDHHANFGSLGPMASLVRGKIWTLGLLPPVLESLSIETQQGTLSLNSGSASIEDDGRATTVQVFDRGATFGHGKQIAFLVAGERVVAHGSSPISIGRLSSRDMMAAWPSENLSLDAVHRSEITKMLAERREKMAGILPTSFLYPAKRLAEEVDVLFTLTHDGRTEKRIQQADTRLSEAVELLRDGQKAEASVPLTEYRNSLLALAAGTGDNLVSFLVRQQIADASASVTQNTPESGAAIVREAVLQVSSAIPDTTLKTSDIEGYVLVDRLAQINRSLSEREYKTGLASYAEIRPYIPALLSDEGEMHPLLKKEAKSLLTETAKLVAEAPKDDITAAAEKDLAELVPQQPPSISDDELAKRVQGMVDRIFVFRHPRSRYNQLLAEMASLQGDANRGTLLRRLKAALPEGLGEYVNTEIQKLGDELKGR